MLARNRRARHTYHVDETLEAGIVLAGSEVKSIRDGKVTLVDAFADIDKGEAWLHQVKIHHPDRLIAQGLPEEAIKVANRKLALINDAYDRLRRQRGLEAA